MTTHKFVATVCNAKDFNNVKKSLNMDNQGFFEVSILTDDYYWNRRYDDRDAATIAKIIAEKIEDFVDGKSFYVVHKGYKDVIVVTNPGRDMFFGVNDDYLSFTIDDLIQQNVITIK